MKKRNSRNGSSDSSRLFLERVYRFLPFFLLVFAGVNVWFLYNFVLRERGKIDNVKSDILHNVSNVYIYVSHSLSNQIERFRFSSDMISRPVFSGGGVQSSQTNSPSSSVTPSPAPIPSPSFVGEIEGYVSRLGGEHVLQLADNSFVTVGDDFGYGRVDAIYRLAVVCDGRRYRVRRPLQPIPPSVKVANNPVNESVVQNGF